MFTANTLPPMENVWRSAGLKPEALCWCRFLTCLKINFYTQTISRPMKRPSRYKAGMFQAPRTRAISGPIMTRLPAVSSLITGKAGGAKDRWNFWKISRAICKPMLWKAFHKLGRKNYLFAGSHEAAQRAAMMYSFLGTCKQLIRTGWLSRSGSRKGRKIESAYYRRRRCFFSGYIIRNIDQRTGYLRVNMVTSTVTGVCRRSCELLCVKRTSERKWPFIPCGIPLRPIC